MSQKLAIKRLSKSDLTLFEFQFKHYNAGNQKSINLNANIFVDKLFPALPEVIDDKGGKLSLDLSIFGPGLNGLHNLQRKIVKHGTYKNWRLNGEFINNPIDNPNRYNVLKEGDFAIFDFLGKEAPFASRMILIASKEPEDRMLHTELQVFLGSESMAVLPSNELLLLVERTLPHMEHPIRMLTNEELLEEAALGGNISFDTIFKGPNLVQISPEVLLRAKKNAETAGGNGEGFVWDYLNRLVREGEVISFDWTSKYNAVAPYDFSVRYSEASSFIDVKSTTGVFQRKIHISLNELQQMVFTDLRYDIYRVYEMTESTAKLRIAKDLKSFAKHILEIFSNLPKGVLPDSISVNPQLLQFGKEIEIQLQPENSE